MSNQNTCPHCGIKSSGFSISGAVEYKCGSRASVGFYQSDKCKIITLTKERDELAKWRNDFGCVLDASEDRFREAVKLVWNLLRDFDNPGIKDVCQVLLETAKERDELRAEVARLKQLLSGQIGPCEKHWPGFEDGLLPDNAEE